MLRCVLALSLCAAVGCVDLELPAELRAINATDGPAGDPDGGAAAGKPAPDAPAPLENGRVCARGEQCASGRCVDGRCCNDACGGACEACNVAGEEGRCTSVPAGEDP